MNYSILELSVAIFFFTVTYFNIAFPYVSVRPVSDLFANHSKVICDNVQFIALGGMNETHL